MEEIYLIVLGLCYKLTSMHGKAIHKKLRKISMVIKLQKCDRIKKKLIYIHR